jgi:hypothetical protein
VREQIYLCNTEKSDSCLSAGNRSLFCVNLLEADVIFSLIKVTQRWPLPLLVLFRVAIFQPVDVLGQLFQNFLFELALLGLT